MKPDISVKSKKNIVTAKYVVSWAQFGTWESYFVAASACWSEPHIKHRMVA